MAKSTAVGGALRGRATKITSNFMVVSNASRRFCSCTASKKKKKEPDAKILHYGCGTSKLSEDLHKGGAHQNIHSIDFSLEAISILREQTAEIPELTWETMDAVNLVRMVEPLQLYSAHL